MTQRQQQQGRVVAVLGPTNTGKTHLALERMCGHASGMIGFPLRLLARENYERVVRQKGSQAVALITGEERILPPHPSYFICTVESMPLDRPVSFLAVDEIQLCADLDRGHIFTDRLLHARGTEETMFLGADTIKPLIRQLVPQAEFIARPRFSNLSYVGPRKLQRMPSRTAVVAFSAADVYALAEILRRQRGGAAVVLGALSPRARNAQVDLYQNGDVDYIVATDAIGMGLNMHVDHVAFAGVSKFDGRQPRLLLPAELAQIAGRAGRHQNDGTFGTTDDVGGLEEGVIHAIEGHSFPPLKRLQWRNHDLRFTGIAALLASLEKQPSLPVLMRAREADDQVALMALAQDAEIATSATHPDRVRLLWEVCRIPDFRKSLAEQHHRLLAVLYRHLAARPGRIPTDWMAAQVQRLDRTDGEIDSLMNRIANVRTWTYISHRGDWVEDARGWQERTRALEDKLSDALHERLTQRFIDRRTAILVRRMRDQGPLASQVEQGGAVLVEGQFVGALHGLRFAPDSGESVTASKVVAAAAQRVLRQEIGRRVEQIQAAPDGAFDLRADGAVLWDGAALARLQAGSDVLSPQLDLLDADWIETAQRESVRRRLLAWLADWLALILPGLQRLRAAPLTGMARGLAWQLVQGLGSLPLSAIREPLSGLRAEEKQQLASLGVQFGRVSVYLPALLKPVAQQSRALLWSVWSGQPVPVPAPPGRVTLRLAEGWDRASAEAIGFRPLGAYAVRLDMLERLLDGLAQATQAARQTTPKDQPVRVIPPPSVLSLLGVASGPERSEILTALGYRVVSEPDQPLQLAPPSSKRQGERSPRSARIQSVDPNNPFAALRDWQPPPPPVVEPSHPHKRRRKVTP